MNHRKMGWAGAAVIAALLIASTVAGVSVNAKPVAAQTEACQEFIKNGGFEQGDTGWTQYSKLGLDLVDPFHAHTGDLGAWLGSRNSAEDWLKQTVTLPADGRSLQLRYWWAVFSEEPPGITDDTAQIELLKPDGSVIYAIETLHNESAEAWDYIETVADLSPYAGQTLQLRFRVTTDAINPTGFFFDDISILACSDEATPTPTATTTGDPTATPRPRLYLPALLR